MEVNPIELSGLGKGGEVDLTSLPLLPEVPTKAELEQYGKAFAIALTDSGWVRSLEAAVLIKRQSVILEAVYDEISSSAIDEMRGDKEVMALGVKITTGTGRSSLNGSDPYIEQVKKYLTDLQAKATCPNEEDRTVPDLFTGEMIVLDRLYKVAGRQGLRLELDYSQKQKEKEMKKS